MRSILIALLIILTPVLAKADERSSEILRKMRSQISSYSSYEVKFKASLQDEFANIDGLFIISGNKFFLDVYESKVFFDGKLRYTYSENDEEVIIENPDPRDNSILSDPTRILGIRDEDFSHSFKGEIPSGANTLEIINLIPKVPNGVFDSMVLKLDKKTSLPVSIEYTLSGMNKVMEINIVAITPNIKVSGDTFTFDRSKYPDVEIIDFR